MNRRASLQIADNIKSEFERIRGSARERLGPSVVIDEAREALRHHIPSLIAGRAQILLDSLLNYLMDDAMDSLASATTREKNGFYALDVRERMKDSFRFEAKPMQFSPDPRLVAGGLAAGGAVTAGLPIVALVLTGVVGRVVVGLATVAAAAIAYRVGRAVGTSSARKALESDVLKYLAQAETEMSRWLGDVRDSFEQAFDEYAKGLESATDAKERDPS